jgi:predicted negative regulator of RcsB-dependent stress response
VEGYTSEDEQLEQLKNWWKKNGTSVIAGLVVGLLAVAGVRYWLDYQSKQSESASVLYEQVLLGLENQAHETVMERGGQIISSYSNTPYANLASLAMAKVKQEEGDRAAARNYLQWVLDNSKDPAIAHVARLRIGHLLYAQGNHDEALQLISAVDPGGFAGAYAALRGDLYAAKGQADQAREQYQLAIAGAAGGDTRYLQMKLDSLGQE